MTDVNRTVGEVKVVWRGDAITKGMRTELAHRVSKSAVMLQRQIVKNISTPSRSAGPSRAGGFPHANTGSLRKSIFNDCVSLIGPRSVEFLYDHAVVIFRLPVSVVATTSPMLESRLV